MDNPSKQMNKSSQNKREVYLKARKTLTWESDQEKLAKNSKQTSAMGEKAYLHTGATSMDPFCVEKGRCSSEALHGTQALLMPFRRDPMGPFFF